MDTLTVHRRFAADMQLDCPPQCTCCTLPDWLPRLNGHVCVRSSDLLNRAPDDFLPPDVRTVLSLNSKDTLWPHGDEGVALEIARGLCSFINRLASLGVYNAVSLSAGDGCVKPRFRSWNSYGPNWSKKLVIYGFFQRMRGYSSDVVNTQTCAGAQLLHELVYTGYPARSMAEIYH